MYDIKNEEEEINDSKHRKKIIKNKKEKEKEKEESNNSRDYGGENDNDNNEPDFYAEEEGNSGYYQSSDSEKDFEKIKQKNLKDQNIDINNIYEINTKFKYSKDLPVFYIMQESKSFKAYPEPFSTSKLVEYIQKNQIPYESIQVKLIDLFIFKSKEPFTYFDLIEVLKPNWATNVDYSAMFNELYKSKKDNENNKVKSTNKKKDKKEKDDWFNHLSKKNNVSEPSSFSVLKNIEKELDTNKDKKELKDDKKEIKEDKKEGNKNNKDKKKGKKKMKEADIKMGFTYGN